MLLSQINTYKNELKERIEFIFYIAFSSKINKSIHKKKETMDRNTQEKAQAFILNTTKNY